jgi:hypothetical protein
LGDGEHERSGGQAKGESDTRNFDQAEHRKKSQTAAQLERSAKEITQPRHQQFVLLCRKRDPKKRSFLFLQMVRIKRSTFHMKNALLSSAVLLGISIFNGNSAQAQTVPAGSALRVRTVDPIDVHSAQPGAKFRGTLADPVMNKNGVVLIPRGTPVQLTAVNVRRAGTFKGRDRIDLKVDSIIFTGRAYPVVSTVAESKGHSRGKRTLTGTGIGAGAGGLIGGLAGGGAGLAVGALVGGGGGTAVAAATGKKHLTIPPESMLSFQLQSALMLK